MHTAEQGVFSTFRDPAGHLSLTADHAARTIDTRYQAHVLEFLNSPARRRWEQGGDLVSTMICTAPPPYRTISLRHPLIFFPSYHWEWTTLQWLAAADLTLKLCSEAISDGWVLKDATPSNILFEGTRPVFVDVLSFERRDPDSGVWLAYSQFVRTFILPLLANRWLGWPLGATLLRRDGYEPEEIYQALSRFRRFHPRLFWTVTLPSFLGGGDKAVAAKKAKSKTQDPALATHLLKHSLGVLKRQVRHAAAPLAASRWSEYAHQATHYGSADLEAKQTFVANVLMQRKPASVLDVGANTGAYSLLAARHGARVVAIDTDHAALERLTETAVQQNADILALAVNIARPTPATGWENRETLTFMERASGKFDLVMMLAVIHHILLTEQIPLDRLAELCSKLAAKLLLLEWVPAGDPMFRALLRGRGQLYGALTEDDFLSAFQPWFSLQERLGLPNGRILFLLRSH